MPMIQLKILDARLGTSIPLPSYVTSGSAGLRFCERASKMR
jgi:dUTPase